jgi:phytoene desaturase
VTVGQAQFDGGPTLMMMLEPFRRLFSAVGERLEDHLTLSKCDPNYRVFFGGGEQLDCTTDMARMIQAIDQLAGPADAAKYPGFIGRLADLYHASMPTFVERNYDSPLDLVRPKSLQIALQHGMLGNLAKGVENTFADPRLRSLFCLQTMYLGLSPYAAPWVYGVLVYMEYGEGIWYPKGGMVEICRSVARLAEARGAEIRLNCAVTSITGSSVELADGGRIEADAVICNADLPYAKRELVPSETEKKSWRHSCSAYMMYIDYVGEIPELLHHNITLGKDFQGNLDQIFDRHEIPDDPAFYAAVSVKADAQMAAEGHLNLFILVPCPNLDHAFTDADGEVLRQRVFARLEQSTAFRASNIGEMRTFTPHDWQTELNLNRGAAFGLSHDFLQSVCFRPSNKSRTEKGLYYVGASTAPGNGLPMVLISADLVVQRLRTDGYLS